MKQALTIFKFEISQIFKNKAYLATTIIFVLLVFFGIFGFSKSVENKENHVEKNNKVSVEQTIVISDPQGKYKNLADNLTKASGGALQYRTSKLDEAGIKKQIQDKKYDAGIVFKDNLDYKYIVRSMSINDKYSDLVGESLKSVAQANYLYSKNLKPDEVQKFFQTSPKSELEVLEKDQRSTFFFTYAIVFLLYMMVVMYGQTVSQSVAGEKSSRAMELLITTAKTENLMFGKVFGIGTAGLIQFSSIIVSGLISYKLFGENLNSEIVKTLFDVSPTLIVFSIICFLSGFYLFAFMYAAAGAVANKIEDLAGLTYPITMAFIVIFIIITTTMNAGTPDSTVMKVLTYIPFSAPMALVTRMSLSGTIPSYAIVLSLIIQAVSIVIIAYLSSIIYKAGTLMYGNKPSFKTIIGIFKSRKSM